MGVTQSYDNGATHIIITSFYAVSCSIALRYYLNCNWFSSRAQSRDMAQIGMNAHGITGATHLVWDPVVPFTWVIACMRTYLVAVS